MQLAVVLELERDLVDAGDEDRRGLETAGARGLDLGVVELLAQRDQVPVNMI